MNKLIELLRGCEHDGAFIPVNEVNRLMQEYGKYCAEEAWREAIQQHSMLSLSNMVNGEFVMKSLDDWWSEFQRKEETK